jgi:hypothetical protein
MALAIGSVMLGLRSTLVTLGICLLAVTACAGAEEDEEDVAADDAAFTEGSITGTLEAGTQVTTTVRLNFREGPSMGSKVLRVLPKGAVLTALGDPPKAGFYRVSHGEDEGWVSGGHIRKVGAADAGADGSASSQPSSGTFKGKKFSNVTMLWQGNWDFLTQCDKFSKGKVVFACSENEPREFVDEGAWIAVPSGSFSRSICNKRAEICKNGSCIVARIVERSVTSDRFEGSTAVLKSLGVTPGFKSCTSSTGTAHNVTVTFE